MKVGQGSDVCYNVQTVVESKHKLIVEHEVTNEPTDQAQLSKMAVRAKQRLEVEQLEVVADRGYYDGAEVKKCQGAGITVYVAKQQTSANQKHGLYTKEEFTIQLSRKIATSVRQGKNSGYRCDSRVGATYPLLQHEGVQEVRDQKASARATKGATNKPLGG